MKFRTSEELLEFMNTIDLEKSTLVFKANETVETKDKAEAEEGCGCGGSDGVCACDSVPVEEEASIAGIEPDQILIESFTGDPKFALQLTEEDSNTFFVKDFYAIADTCGTGSITLEDRETKMNMCEMDGVAIVTLDVVIEGKKLKGVPFTLVKTEGKSYLQLSKSRIL